MPQDFQKREAKQCLWDQDGVHTKKRSRNRGKGRGKDKRLINELIKEFENESSIELDIVYDKEISEAIYCEFYDPCKACISSEERIFIEDLKNLENTRV